MGFGNNGTPIGSIVAYGGVIDGATLAALAALGWHPCNGDLLDRASYPDLAAIIGRNFGGTDSSFNVPDLRGRFIRGFSGTTSNDPDKDTRSPSAPGGPAGNHVGTVQSYSTALPSNKFVTSVDGLHSHTSDKIPQGENDNAGAFGSIHGYPESGTQTSSSAGSHTHSSLAPSPSQQSGDAETRPMNVLVNFLIKCKDSASTTGTFLPVGTILMYCAEVGDTVASGLGPNWLPVEGQTLTDAMNLYPELYMALSENAVLEPSGGTTIKLPDLRGYFIRARTHDEIPGQVHPYQTALPQRTPIAFNTTGEHTHQIYSGTCLGTSDHCGGHSNAYGGNTVATDSAGNHFHEVNGGGDAETRPINLALDFIIRVRNP